MHDQQSFQSHGKKGAYVRMNKVIWTCWFQGRDQAPQLVQRCLSSWETQNPTWELRCLDSRLLQRYVDIPSFYGKIITHASLSDVLRILLLREYGGIWADATLLCNRPLDTWLDAYLEQGFFAFARPPGSARPLSTWFLATEEHHLLVARWCARTLDFWAEHRRADDYFWSHGLFRDLLKTDPEFAHTWNMVPKVSVDGPCAIHHLGMATPAAEVSERVDWQTPVFKLTYRIDERALGSDTLLSRALDAANPRTPTSPRHLTPLAPTPSSGSRTCHAARQVLPSGPCQRKWRILTTISVLASSLRVKLCRLVARKRTSFDPTITFASLKVSTENIGDHIQILAGRRLLARLGVHPTVYIDRDNEIASCDTLRRQSGQVAMLLNGWFKTNRNQWPPHPKIVPVFLGFHIRLFQCPELLSNEAVNYYTRYAPIGCRDVHTERLLRKNGIEAFVSNCLTLTLPRRRDDPRKQSKVFVVSRDRRMLDMLPKEICPYTYVSHYTGSRDFHANMSRAERLLNTYCSEARLIVTTLLHCALPAIAMGILVVVFYPLNDETRHASDRERFSALQELVPVYRLDEMDRVNWNPSPVPVGRQKLTIIDQLSRLAAERWSLPEVEPVGPIAPSSALPVP